MYSTQVHMQKNYWYCPALFVSTLPLQYTCSQHKSTYKRIIDIVQHYLWVHCPCNIHVVVTSEICVYTLESELVVR